MEDTWVQELEVDGFEFPPGPPLIIMEEDLTEGEVAVRDMIEAARESVLTGLQDTTKGRLAIVKGLNALKEKDRWKDDPIIAHLDHEPRWKDDYLTELAAWIKERDPNLQCGVNTMMNYLRYYKQFVLGWGIDEEKVFGASEHTRRAINRMCDWDPDTKMPTRLRPRYSLDSIPGDAPLEDKMREVAEGALALGRYSPDYFENFATGDGHERVDISVEVVVDPGYVLKTWRVFIKKTSADGEPLASFAVDLCKGPMPFEMGDYLEELGWQITIED